MTRVFNRMTTKLPPIAVRAEGMHIWDSTGKSYIDACGGAAVSCLGHNDARVAEAMAAQMKKLDYVHPGFFSGEPAEHLADLLLEDAPKGLDYAYFVSGGSEAMEAALKMARQYFLEIGQPKRSRFISRRQSYHGNTLGALAVGGNLARREPYAPMLMDVSLIAPCFAYRFKRDDESDEQYGRRVADELEAEILRLGPETVAGFTAETVVGATTGCVAAVPGYFKRIREICDKYGVLLILDEVMSGMGRTGTLHACEQEGIAPDLMTIAKGLGGGFPVGAVMATEQAAVGMTAGTHGSTFGGNPLAMAVANAVLDVMLEPGFLERVDKISRLLWKELEALVKKHPKVFIEVRGAGLMLGLRCHIPNTQLVDKLRENGLLAVGAGENVVRLVPPLIIDEIHVREAVEKIDKAAAEVAV